MNCYITHASTGLILGIYMLPYPKAVSDSMQKEIRHKNKQTKKEEEMKARSTKKMKQLQRLLWSI